MRKEEKHVQQICENASSVSAWAQKRNLYRNVTRWEVENHLKEIGEAAEEMFERLVEQMKKAEGVTEQLKAENQMEWVGRMNCIRSRAEEIVLNDLIYNWIPEKI